MLSALSFGLLQSNRVQTFLSDKLFHYISENLHARFTLKSINIKFFNTVSIDSLYVEDPHKDTLLLADHVTVKASNLLRALLNQKKNRINIKEIELDNSIVNLITDSTGTINLQFIIDAVSGKKDTPSKNKKGVIIRKVSFKNSRVAIKRTDSTPKDFGVNFSDLMLNHFNADIRNIKPVKDTVNMQIRHLSFEDKSGLIVNNFSTEFTICSKQLFFGNVTINTPQSNISAPHISLSFNDFKAFKGNGIFDQVRLNILLNKSDLNLNDLAYFAPVFRSTDQSLELSGNISGYLSNIKGQNIRLNFGRHSYLTGNLNLTGLPDIRETFIVFDLNELNTNPSDLERLNLPGQNKIELPPYLAQLGNFSYRGNFTGFITDFVAYGRLHTNIGNIRTDLMFKPDTARHFAFNGKLEMDKFNIGKLLSTEKLGEVTLQASVKGTSASGKTIDANMNGNIKSIEINAYTYNNIRLLGELTNNTYNGSITIEDPNIGMDFKGKVDFSKKIPTYDFSANVNHANLYALHFDKTNPTHTASFFIKAKASGNSLENLNGEISLLNSLFTKDNDQIQIYDFNLIAKNNADSNSFNIRSDFLDADLTGKFNMNEAKKSFRQFLHVYLPALTDSNKIVYTNFKSNFNFDIKFKKTRPIFNYFFPGYYVDDNSIVRGSYNPEENAFSLFMRSPQIKFKGNTWNKMYMNISSDDSTFSITSGSENLLLANRITLKNFSVYSNVFNDTIDVLTRWNNWDSAAYKGSFIARAAFTPEGKLAKPAVSVNIMPSTIVTQDTLWVVNRSRITYDSSGLAINNFIINHEDQSFIINGKLSKKETDSLTVNFNKFNLDNLNILAKNKGFQFKGIIDGHASVSNVYENPLFKSKLNVDNLIINGEDLGFTEINSSWNNSKKAIHLQAVTTRGSLKTINIEGDYFPKNNGALAFTIDLDKLRLNIISPYVQQLLDDVRGLASGTLSLNGTISQPLLNGSINFQKTIFTFKYLQTRYNFTQKINILNNNILLDNLKLFDEYGSYAIVNGSVRDNYFKDFRFDISLNANDFLFLNTSHADNSMYYGTAFASGLVKFTGTPKNINLDVKAKTEPNTRFFIPLGEEGNISDYSFISFYNEDSTLVKKQNLDNYKVNLSGMQMNFDLDVTQDAELQLIFDPKVGDIIKGRGNGDIKMAINTLGKFSMYGEYTITSGDYLFTLQDVINKKLKVESGSKVTWTGDPVNADIDIQATYRTKASLYDLFPSTDEAENNYSKNRATIDCQLFMTGKLMNPNIKYDIYLPFADEQTRDRVKNAITSEEDLSKQFLSLLVMGRFLPNLNQKSSNPNYLATGSGVNASELLSNQLSNWLSQISNDFDIGVNYRPGDQITSREMEFALSTQLLNDRLSINGNVDVTTNAAANSTNNIVGDFDVDYKLNKSGKLQIKAYNRANDNMIYENSPYTQGVGLLYKEEFNTFGELLKNYWHAITGIFEGKKKQRADSVDNSAQQINRYKK